MSWKAVTIAGMKYANRADRAGQHETERDQEPEHDPGAPHVMAPHRGALSSHLRLYNELG